jgi:phospholipid/cholesterol/gamma-HCH transport system permease protein
LGGPGEYGADGGIVVNAVFDAAERPLIALGSVSNGVQGAVAAPVRGVGGFFAMTLDTFVAAFTTRFAWREFIDQTWFIARVSMVPAVLLAIPFTTFVVFLLNILLLEIGAADLSGSASAVAVIQIGPIVDVLVVAGAGATAICADLGARTIREELDAMRVMGINPIQALVVPRVAAGALVALMLMAIVTLSGLLSSFVVGVYIQGVTPGAYVSSMTLLVGLGTTIVAMIKALLYGITASLIACYKGTTVGGGPQGVGNAVNETVIYAFVALFAINIVMTAIDIKVNPT